MKNTITILILVFSVFILCTTYKFKALQSETLTCQEERDLLRAENEKLSVENKELSAKLARAEKMLGKAGQDTLRWQEEVTGYYIRTVCLKMITATFRKHSKPDERKRGGNKASDGRIAGCAKRFAETGK